MMFQAYWDQVVAAAPWLAEVPAWFELLKPWAHTIESIALFGGLFWISHRIKAERHKMSKLVSELGENLDEQISTAAQLAKAARDSAEAAAGSTASGLYSAAGSLAHWEQLRSEWHDVRDRIELAIKRIKNSRVRGKYANFERYSYHDIIVTLGKDEEIPKQAQIALINMNHKFMAMKSRPSQTTAKDVADFAEWKKAINGSLPRLPKSQPPMGPQPPQLPVAAE